MKFTVARDALGEAVAFISRALPSRPVVPVLSGMLVEAAAEGLTLSCFDYEVSARVRVEAEVSAPGRRSFPAGCWPRSPGACPTGPPSSPPTATW